MAESGGGEMTKQFEGKVALVTGTAGWPSQPRPSSATPALIPLPPERWHHRGHPQEARNVGFDS